MSWVTGRGGAGQGSAQASFFILQSLITLHWLFPTLQGEIELHWDDTLQADEGAASPHAYQ